MPLGPSLQNSNAITGCGRNPVTNRRVGSIDFVAKSFNAGYSGSIQAGGGYGVIKDGKLVSQSIVIEK